MSLHYSTVARRLKEMGVVHAVDRPLTEAELEMGDATPARDPPPTAAAPAAKRVRFAQ